MTVPPEQLEAAAFLRRLAGRDPTETHISAVFVGPLTVWKMKKAVRLSFLDFSALDDRRRFLEREVELNQPAAPGIYRDVAAVVRGRHGPLAITPEPGDREVLEWVLRMAPIPEQDFLDTVAARGELSPGLLDALGDRVTEYHRARPPVPDQDSAAALQDVATGNAHAAIASGLPEPVIRNWLDEVRAALSERSGWLAERAGAGLVRRGHGDLHLGNLCLWKGAPVPFDALEFDERMATIDLGYDLAFLLMDLDQRADRPAANRVMNRYLARTGDTDLLRGLPLFLSLRAMVLAHVQQSRGNEEASAGYLQAALDYLHPVPPVVLAIGGLPGTGKSTLARMLAPELGAAPGAFVARSDEIRKRRFGAGPEERLPASAYTETVNAELAAAVAEATRLAAAGGQAVVADATFIDPEHRLGVAVSAAAAGVPFLGIWLEAPLAVLESRIIARRGDASDATIDVLLRSAARDHGAIDWLKLDAQDLDRTASIVRQELRRRIS